MLNVWLYFIHKIAQSGVSTVSQLHSDLTYAFRYIWVTDDDFQILKKKSQKVDVQGNEEDKVLTI